MHSHVKLGDIVAEGDVIAHIGDSPVVAPLGGMVRGLLNNGLTVREGFKIGDIDLVAKKQITPRCLTRPGLLAAVCWKPCYIWSSTE